MKKRRFFSLISLMLAVSLFVRTPMGRAEDKAQTVTLMVYMCGSNLESGSGAATLDLLEMANAGYDFRQVNLLVMTGGTTRWTLGLPTDALCIYQPARGQLRMLYAFEPMSMGSADALTALLDFGYERYPADRYALILWDHGGGPLEGLCWDENYDGDRLTLAELCQGLGQSPAAARGLDWIGFDACLMASTEVAKAVSPYAKYMIASQETEPGTGWNYAFLDGLNEDADGLTTGKRIIDLYVDGAEDRRGMTLSCVDLSRMAALSSQMDALFSRVEITAGNYARYSFAATRAHAFGKSASGTGGYDLVDLWELIAQMEDSYPEEARAVDQALSEAVRYNRSGDGQGRGMSVYHPYQNKADYAAGWGAAYPALGFSEGYASYLSRFASYLFGSQAVSWAGMNPLPTSEEGVMALPLTKEQTDMLLEARVDLLLWDEDTQAYAPVGSLSNMVLEDGTLYAAMDGRSLAVLGSDGEILGQGIPYEVTPEGEIGIYVNLCAAKTADRPEAARILPVDISAERKSGWNVTIGTESAEETINAGTSTTSGTQTNQTLETETVSLAEALGIQNRGVLTAVSPWQASADAGWADVPVSVSGLFDQAGAAWGTGTNAYTVPQTGQTLAVTPVSLTDLNGEFGTVSYSGSQLSLNQFPAIDVESFDPSVTLIETGGYQPAKAEKPAEEVLHLWLRCAVSPEGEVSVRQVWRYDAASDHWSAAESFPAEAGYDTAVFPVRWYRPVADEEGALCGASTWQEAEQQAGCTVRGEWTLGLRPDADPALCAAFCLTDHQNRQHESVPVLLSDLNGNRD